MKSKALFWGQVSDDSDRFTFPLLQRLQGRQHTVALVLYVGLVMGHFSEHLIQIAQVYLLRWPRAMSMGILGIYLPELMRSEVLHFSYNLIQLLGLLFLVYGMRGQAQKWWRIAILAQSWHFFEHALLQAQWVSGRFLFGAARQSSIGELFLSRIELHLIYVTLAVVPTMIGIFYHVAELRRK